MKSYSFILNQNEAQQLKMVKHSMCFLVYFKLLGTYLRSQLRLLVLLNRVKVDFIIILSTLPSKALPSMNKITSPFQLQEHSYLHQSTITDTSIAFKRISRKTDQTSASRRSLSRHSSSKSNEKINPSSFFVKMSTLEKISDESTTTVFRNGIMTRQDSRTEKKRSPTPLPGKLTRSRAKQKETEKQNIEMENELLIAELQTQLSGQKEKVRIFERKAVLLEKQLKCKVIKIEDLQRTVEKALQKERELLTRLRDSQEQNQKDQVILEPKSKLEKFKNNIKQNRLTQVQFDNSRLRRENQELKRKIASLEHECKQWQERCTSLESQLHLLQHQPAQEKHDLVIHSKNHHFEDMLLSREEYNMRLQARVSKLEIQLNYMNRKKMEQIQQWKEKKNKEVTRVRGRLASINKQFVQLRKQNERLRKSLRNSDISLSRSSLIGTTHSWTSREDVIELSLSPQHFQY